ncbi:MAG: tail fiber domain-containing protein, partial [Candidatus Margulisiibacteriota bacterium]
TIQTTAMSGSNYVLKAGDTMTGTLTNTAGANLATSSGNVGIGTASPGAKLEIFKANVYQDPPADLIKLAHSSSWDLRVQSEWPLSNGEINYNFVQKKNGVDRNIMSFYGDTVTNAGNVGIGTTAPGSRLAVKGATADSGASALNVTASTDATLLYVRNDGNVGIGTASPDEKLTLPYNSYIGWEYSSGNSTVSHKIGKTSDGAGPMAFVTTHNPGDAGKVYTFSSGAGEKLTLLYGGNVGIGSTEPGSKLTVAGTIETTVGGIKFPDTTIQTTAMSGSNYVLKAGDTMTGTLTNTAGVHVGNGAYNAPAFSFSGDPDTGFYWGASGQINVASNASTIMYLAPDAIKYELPLQANNPDALSLKGNAADSATAIGLKFGNVNALNTAGAKIASFYSDNLSTEKAHIKNTGGAYFAGSVGIGTTAPGQKLSVAGTIEMTAGGIKFPDTTIQTTAVSGSNYVLKAGDTMTGTLTNTAGANLATSSGSVGIGTTAPGTKLDILQASDAVTSGIRVSNVGQNRALYLWADSSNVARVDSGSTGAGNLAINGAGTGNVGIGTTSPGTYKLAVSGDVSIEGKFVGANKDGGTPRFAYGYNADASGGYGAVAMGYNAKATGTAAVALGDNVQATGSNGSVAIGIQSVASGMYATALGSRMTAQGDYSFGIGLDNTAGRTITAANTMAIMGGNVGIGTTSPSVTFEVAGKLKATGGVYFSGLAAGTGTTLVLSATTLEVLTSSSSRRYKKDIVDYQADLNKIGELRPVRFRWNEHTATPDRKDFGMIAEEVVKVFPELVELNASGSPESVHYEKLSVILLQGYQEKAREIEALKAQNLALEARMKAIEEKLGR